MTGDVVPAGSQHARTQLGLPGADQEYDGSSVTVDRMVTLAFVLSLCGILIWGCALVGLVLGLVARRTINDQGRQKRRMVTASIIISAIPIALGVAALLGYLGFLAIRL